MSRRSPPTRRVWIVAVAVLAATGSAASVARTQQVAGSIGASLTILEPIAASLPPVTAFSLGGDGVARIETTVPESSRPSPLVMMRVASSPTEPAPPPPLPMYFVPIHQSARARCLLNIGRGEKVGRDDRTAGVRPRTLRVDYLIVAAGT